MKTKIASLCLAAVFGILSFASNSSAAEPGFYDKDHIRGFISFGGEFHGMMPRFNDYVNEIALFKGQNKYLSDTTIYYNTTTPKYKKFGSNYPGMQLAAGAQYKQFMTWIDVNFMITQVSERPSKKITATADDGSTGDFPLYDGRWFSYGADWMFGWKILGENAFFNLIPSVGIGFSMINLHFTSNWVYTNTSTNTKTTLRDRYYSNITTSFNAELEARLQFEQFSIGLYGGYRVARYNELNADGSNLNTLKFDTDNSGDNWYVGIRFAWTFLSLWDKKQLDKI